MLLSANMYITNPTWIEMGLNPDFRSEKYTEGHVQAKYLNRRYYACSWFQQNYDSIFILFEFPLGDLNGR